MSNNQTQASFPLLSVLGIVFIILKLTSVINWSWWLVLLPFYGLLVVTLGVLVTVLFVALVAKGADQFARRRRRAALA